MSQPTSWYDGPNPGLADKIASLKGRKPGTVCVMCMSNIETMCFRGTGVCGEICRKVKDGELLITDRARTP